MHGEVIGITYAGERAGENLNFAIPINELESLSRGTMYTLKEVYEREHVINYKNGDKYVGDIVDGEPNGIGMLTFVNGTICFGEWVNGMMNGYGVIKYADGSYYEGEFKDDMFHGKGIIQYGSGELKGYTLMGTWKEGKLHGKVMVITNTGEMFEVDLDKIPMGN